VLDLAGPGVDVVGFVDDLRPYLASAAALVVPLRLGGGTRLKIVEGMAMGRPIVSTTLGAEGIEATPERDILIADEPAAFAASVIRLLDDPALRRRLGQAGRQLAVERYSWAAAAARLEVFLRALVGGRARAAGSRWPPGRATAAPRGAS
jgi:glycosyltransferase involved in cell wall biosynthesis